MHSYNEQMNMEEAGTAVEWQHAPQADTLAATRELGRSLAEAVREG